MFNISFRFPGGVGVLASGPLNATETREAIRKIRATTDKPFGVG
jgi:enoyl-[acyl-carrier protein] reductase II